MILYKSGEGNIKTLSGVTGHIQHKELVAIMGYDQPSVLNYLSLFLIILPDASLCSCVHSGSGGGKSTLTDILSGR